MKMNRSGVVIFFIKIYLIILLSPLVAQVSAPKYSNEYLNIGVGARALSMGKAQVAIAQDAESSYWNPSNLIYLKQRHSVGLMHASFFAGVANYDYAAYATKMDSSQYLGFTALRFGVDQIPDTRFLYDANGRINYNNIRFFSAADYALLVSYAKRIKRLKNFNVGANVKIIYRRVGQFAQAWGFGLDVGSNMEINGLRLGLIIRDITSTFNVWSHNASLTADVYSQTGNEIPTNSVEITLPKMIWGLGKQWRFWQERIGVLPSMDIEWTFDGARNVPIKTSLLSIDPRLGVELDYRQVGFLRFGAGSVQQVKNFQGEKSYIFSPSFGVGVHIKQVKIDYALTSMGELENQWYSHVFTLHINWNELEI